MICNSQILPARPFPEISREQIRQIFSWAIAATLCLLLVTTIRPETAGVLFLLFWVLHQNFKYGAWGEVVGGNSAADATPFGFTGRWGGYWDARVNRVLNWNRWYEPQVGRWGNQDPAGIQGGVNLFVYADNSAATMIDRDGLKPCCDPSGGGDISYNAPPPKTELISCALQAKVSCFANCMKSKVVITGGSEGGHKGTAHPRGHAVDFSFWRNPNIAKNLDASYECASFCGFKWGQPEMYPDNPNNNHLHIQDEPYHKKNYLPHLGPFKKLWLWYWTYVAY